MSIVRIEVENFKSYKGHQIIGPFKNFTAIIGPNGAGKSNLMDAMSFVLGVQAQTLRSGNLKDLIYRVEGEPATKRTAQVKLIFDTGKETLVFSRSISAAGKGEYRIDNKVFSEEQYTERLKSFNILVKARNFLVFQGDVVSVASKSPKEITQLIEQISGSDELKAQYDAALMEKERAEEDIIFSAQKKKGIAAEKKEYKLQTKEADRFNDLLTELNRCKLNYTLWQLYHIDKELKKREKERQAAVLQLGQVQAEQTTLEKDITGRRKEHGKRNKEFLLQEKRLKQQHDELEAKRPSAIKLRETVQHLQARLRENRAALTKGQQDFDAQQAELAKLEAELEDLLKAQKAFEAADKKLLEDKRSVPQSQIDEYNKRKEAAGVQTAARRQELDSISRQQKVDTDQRDALQGKENELTSRLKILDETEASLQERKKKVEAWVAETNAKIDELKKAEKAREREMKELNARQQSLSAEAEEVQAKLQEAKSDRRESERDTKMKENLETLKRLYPSVLGRVVDLCKISQPNKYSVAVTVAMGSKMEAIVVQDEKTAMECIQYMREQRVGIATFLPLDTLKVKPFDDRLRQKGRLVTDVLTYDPVVAKAVQYACGNILLCETLDEAKQLCFGKERHKAVTTDGTLVEKSGLMTGGISGVADRAKKWNDKLVDDLKRKRDSAFEELQEIARKLRTLAADQQPGAVQSLEKRLNVSHVDLQTTAEKLKAAANERAELEKQKSALAKDLNRLNKLIAGRVAEIERLTKAIHDMEEKIFADFSKAAGVPNIRAYEETKLRTARENAEKRVQFAQQVGALQNHIAFERAKDLGAPLKRLKTSIADDEKALAKAEKEHSKAREQEAADEEALADIRRQVAEAKQLADEADAELSTLKKKLNGAINLAGSVQKRISAEEGSLEQLKNRRHNIFHRCKVEDLALPLAGGGELAPQAIEEPKQTSAEPMEIDQGSRRIHEKEDAIDLDFSGLDRKQTQISTASEYEEQNQRHLEEIHKLATEMERLAPNMKAKDRLSEVTAKLQTTLNEVSEVRKVAEAAQAKFYALKQERVNRFMEGFNHISDAIDKIYKDLTKSADTPGGTAYLSLENKEEPFNGGVKYNAMPPKKRFRDMDQLSGGEQTVAALALLFAIHSYQHAPFFILDEVDAALDASNVNKIAKYIRYRSSQNLQCIVISLKEAFFERADVLIGVYRDQGMGCSRTLAVDVNALAGTEETPKKTTVIE